MCLLRHALLLFYPQVEILAAELHSGARGAAPGATGRCLEAAKMGAALAGLGGMAVLALWV